MRLIKQFCEITNISHVDPLKSIEQAGRTCYKSEDKITDTSSRNFVKMLLKNGHHSVIEHVSASVKFVTDRGVTHELVRHRLSSYSQESTRYVNYDNKPMVFIIPVWFEEFIQPGIYKWGLPGPTILQSHMESWIWFKSMANAMSDYNNLINKGQRPEQARSVLPNSLKTEIIMTANLREWRHVLQLRTSNKAHPQIKKLMRSLLDTFRLTIPVIFDDIGN